VCNIFNKKLALCNTQRKVEPMNPDRLELLKAKCEQEIRAAEESLRVLKAKRDNLIALAQESEKLANPESEPDKYGKTGLTEAVFDAVKEIWLATGKAATAPQIHNYLLAHGFKAGENFGTAIYTVLTRLCESHRITWGHVSKHVPGMPPPRKCYRPIDGIMKML